MTSAMMEWAFPNPTIFAHRGSSLDAPENTLAAFELAVQQGAHAIELDAQLSADGHVVVIHDSTVDRTTNGQGRVNEMSLEALKQLDAGSHHSPHFKNEKIPTLNEVLKAVGHKVLVNIELKNDTNFLDDLPRRVAEIVDRHTMQSRIIFSSFNPIALYKIKQEIPETPCGFLTAPDLWDAGIQFIGRLFLDYEALHPDARTVTPELVQKAHEASRRINVYTVNDPNEMQKLITLGVDGIITDNPRLAVQILADMG